jgi:transposase-like protein
LARKPGKEGLDMTDITERAPARNSDDSRDQDRIPFHPLADLFPLMEGAEFDELVADIEKHGLREAIVLYDGMILDGRNRYRACLAAKVEIRFEKHFSEHHSADEALAFIISKNIHRRHLKPEDRARILAELVAAQPGKSNRQLAKEAGVSHPTIAKARRTAEATGKALPVDKRTGADGKARRRPAKKAKGRPGGDAAPVPRAEITGEDEGVAPTDEITSNFLDTVSRHRAVHKAYKKVFAKVFEVSAFDRAQKDEIRTAIRGLISQLQSLERVPALEAPVRAGGSPTPAAAKPNGDMTL